MLDVLYLEGCFQGVRLRFRPMRDGPPAVQHAGEADGGQQCAADLLQWHDGQHVALAGLQLARHALVGLHAPHLFQPVAVDGKAGGGEAGPCNTAGSISRSTGLVGGGRRRGLPISLRR